MEKFVTSVLWTSTIDVPNSKCIALFTRKIAVIVNNNCCNINYVKIKLIWYYELSLQVSSIHIKFINCLKMNI